MISLGTGNLIRRTQTLCRSFIAHKPRVSTPLGITTQLNLPTAFKRMSSSQAKRLAGKTILVTGASSGIGKSTALEFARTQPDDLKLILTARREETLKEVKKEIEGVAKGVKVHVVKLDVSNVSEIGQFVGNLPAEFKEIDVLVNNACVPSHTAQNILEGPEADDYSGLVKGVDKAPEIKQDDINVMFQTNVTGLIAMTQAILPIFLARPDGGRGDIINIGSIAGREPYQGGSIYCATKAAVRSFTDSLRKELIASRVRVIEIDPGQVETEFSVVRFGGDKEKAKKVYEGVEPLTGDDIAEVVVFAAARRENVVIADTLVFPNHQVSPMMGVEGECLLTCDSGGGNRYAQEVDTIEASSATSKQLRMYIDGASNSGVEEPSLKIFPHCRPLNLFSTLADRYQVLTGMVFDQSCQQSSGSPD